MSYGKTKQDNAVKHNQAERERLNKDIQTKIIDNIHKRLEEDDINFSGNLSGSFEAGIDSDTGFHTVQTTNKYAHLVENGMPAGSSVNIDALRYWVEEKLGVSKDESLEVTMKIFNKIKSTGIRPKRYFKKSIKAFIGKHGKHSISVKGRQKNRTSRFGKAMKKMFKSLKRLIKDLKAINRKVKKITKPINRARKRAV